MNNTRVPDTSVLYKSVEGHRRAMDVYDELLADLTVPYETHWVTTRHGLTHVIAAGHPGAPPIALWHGLDASAPTWVKQINDAAGAHRVYAVDVIGSMGRSSPVRLDRAGDDYGEWMAEVLTGLKVEQAHHVGISNGAWLILKLAGVMPDMIASAVLISPGGIVRPRWQLIFKMLPGFFLRPKHRGAHFLKVMGAPGVPPSRQDVAMFDILTQDFRYERAPGAMPDVALAHLTAPTYVLVGEFEAAFTPSKIVDRVRTALPNLWKAEILSGVGHGMITEDPRAVNERILSFIGAQIAAG